MPVIGGVRHRQEHSMDDGQSILISSRNHSIHSLVIALHIVQIIELEMTEMKSCRPFFPR